MPLGKEASPVRIGYAAIADDLQREIAAERIVVGSLLPSEREIQEQFGVSRSVVRRALTEIVARGWGEVRPNRGVVAIRGRSSDRNSNVALIDDESSVNRQLFVRLSSELQERGRHLVLLDSAKLGFEGSLEYANRQGFEAAFAWSKVGYPDAGRVRSVCGEMPVIALDHGLQTVTTDLVSEDNTLAGRMATSHLIQMGRRNVAVSGMLDMSETFHDRFGGYLQGLLDHDIVPSVRNFLFCTTSGMAQPDIADLVRRLKEPDRPDAIFVMQDIFLPDVVDAIERCGLSVPDDIALVTFRDDVTFRFGDVGVTSVVGDWDRFAQASADLLWERIDRPLRAPETIRLPVRLIIRGSCGAPRDQWAPSSSSSASVMRGLQRA